MTNEVHIEFNRSSRPGSRKTSRANSRRPSVQLESQIEAPTLSEDPAKGTIGSQSTDISKK